MRTLSVTAIALLCVLATAQAPDINQLRTRAQAGDSKAQVELGAAYAAGTGVAKDDQEAARWFEKAAKKDDAEAQFRLAQAYASGQGVKQDLGKAAGWMKKAAEQGNLAAISRLGLIFLRGEGVAQDNAKALKLLREGAERNDAVAEYGMALIYAEGRGVERDMAKAMDWYEKAAAQDHPWALRALALVLTGPSKKNPTEAHADRERAVALAEKAVEVTGRKNAETLDTLATTYYRNGETQKAVAAEREASALVPDQPGYQEAVKAYEQGRPPASHYSLFEKNRMSAPRAIRAPDPVIRSGAGQGTVVVWAVVGADGKVKQVKIARSVNHELDESALEAVRQWIFEPARRDGTPVAVQINVEVNFR
ncbi:MAG TPA: TonB family protein [Terriglobales bacterium]|nr:TonB family protein [Terriglobales bacterium]